jgi:hypothetical protein
MGIKPDGPPDSDDVLSSKWSRTAGFWRPFEFSIDALYPNRRYVAAKVRSFIDLLAKHFHEPASIAAGAPHVA